MDKAERIRSFRRADEKDAMALDVIAERLNGLSLPLVNTYSQQELADMLWSMTDFVRATGRQVHGLP